MLFMNCRSLARQLIDEDLTTVEKIAVNSECSSGTVRNWLSESGSVRPKYVRRIEKTVRSLAPLLKERAAG